MVGANHVRAFGWHIWRILSVFIAAAAVDISGIYLFNSLSKLHWWQGLIAALVITLLSEIIGPRAFKGRKNGRTSDKAETVGS